MKGRLVRLGLLAATTCSLLANAEGFNAGRAGLAPRQAANANLLRRAAAADSLSPRGKEPIGQHPAKRNPAEAEDAEYLDLGEYVEEGDTPVKTPVTKTASPSRTSGTDNAGTKSNARKTTSSSASINSPAVEPTRAPVIGKAPLNKAPVSKAPVQAYNHVEGAPAGGDDYADDELLEDCDDDEPATVYVTVTVDENGAPLGGGAVGPAPTGGNGGGVKETPVECIEGCYDGGSTPAGGAVIPVATGVDEEEEDSIDETEEDDTEETEEEEDPVDETDETDEDTEGEPDGWDDVVGGGGAGASASASASASGADFDMGGAAERFNGMPVVISLVVCAFTSIAAGLFFAGV